MALLKVYEFPHPILKKVCSSVTEFNSALESFISDLTETLKSHKYCVGLAAPQVGRSEQIIIIDISRARKPQPNNGLLTLINPSITESSDFKIVREGCLSIPNFTANVKRAMTITVTYQDIKGNFKSLSTKHFEAHAIQHENDHLEGILFLDRITSPASDLFRRIKKD